MTGQNKFEAQLKENEIVKSTLKEAYKDVDTADNKIKRSWNPQLIPQYQLPDYIKYDPVLWQFFSRLNYKDKNFIAVIVGETGCQPAGSKVLMANGKWKNIEDVKIKDKLISPDSSFGNVIELHKYDNQPIYGIYSIKNNELLYRCAGNHSLSVYIRNRKTGIKKRFYITAEKLYNTHKNGNITHEKVIKRGYLIKKFYKTKNPKIDPYIFGALIGDGYICNIGRNKLEITSNNNGIIKEIEKRNGVMAFSTKLNTNARTYRISTKTKFYKDFLKYNMFNVRSETKYIPDELLLSDYKYRLELLSGLIDTDGYINKRGNIEYCTKSKILSDNIKFLVNSLGGIAHIRYVKKKCYNNGKYGMYYQLSINLGKQMNLLSLYNNFKKNRIRKYYYKIPSNISFYIKKENKFETVYGFTLDSKFQLYITDNFTETKNSGKSITALNLARAIDITPLGNGKFKRNFIIKALPNGKPIPQTRVVFGPSDFLRLVKSGLPRGSVIVWDEAGIGNDAVSWQDKKSRLIKHIMQTFRSRNYGLFMTVPDKESITLSTRRLVHCYIDVTKRDDTHAYLDIRWLNRVRGNEKTETYYKYPVFKDPLTGKLKKIIRYKVPKIDPAIEKEYNKIKDTVLQNMYEYYQKEMEFMEKELGEKSQQGPESAIKLKKFNMAACTEFAKSKMEDLRADDSSYSEAKVMFELSKNGYDCNKSQAKLVCEMLREYESLGIA